MAGFLMRMKNLTSFMMNKIIMKTIKGSTSHGLTQRQSPRQVQGSRQHRKRQQEATFRWLKLCKLPSNHQLIQENKQHRQQQEATCRWLKLCKLSSHSYHQLEPHLFLFLKVIQKQENRQHKQQQEVTFR